MTGTCRECDSHNVAIEGGCPICRDCGWSKCNVAPSNATDNTRFGLSLLFSSLLFSSSRETSTIVPLWYHSTIANKGVISRV